MDKIMYEDKKTKQVKVQYGVEASIDKKYLNDDIYEKFYDFTTYTFNAVNIYQNKELIELAQKYLYIVKNFAGTVKQLKNLLDKMNSNLCYEIKKVQKRGM